MNIQELFELYDMSLCNTLAAKTNHLITTLHGCVRDKNGSPAHKGTIYNGNNGRYGFYAWVDRKEVGSVGAGYSLNVGITDAEYNQIYEMFIAKYKIKSWDEYMIDLKKIEDKFENAAPAYWAVEIDT